MKVWKVTTKSYSSLQYVDSKNITISFLGFTPVTPPPSNPLPLCLQACAQEVHLYPRVTLYIIKCSKFANSRLKKLNFFFGGGGGSPPLTPTREWNYADVCTLQQKNPSYANVYSIPSKSKSVRTKQAAVTCWKCFKTLSLETPKSASPCIAGSAGKGVVSPLEHVQMQIFINFSYGSFVWFLKISWNFI